jgi:TolB-like protein
MKKLIQKLSFILAGMLLFATITSAQDSTARENAVSVNSRNRVAVMPLSYIGNDNEARSEEMKYQLQNLTVNLLHSAAAELKFLDPAEINAILLKNGITVETIRQYTPAELAKLLHVEYIIMGSVIQDEGSVVTQTNSNTVRRGNNNHYYNHGKTKTYRNERTETRQNIETQVSVSIYNETGENIYSKSRHSILTESDAYKNALQYLLKRCPLYKR